MSIRQGVCGGAANLLLHPRHLDGVVVGHGDQRFGPLRYSLLGEGSKTNNVQPRIFVGHFSEGGRGLSKNHLSSLPT